MKVVYMCRPEFVNEGLRERPLTQNGGFQGGPTLKNEGTLELKITKKRIFLKRGGRGGGSFGAAQVGIVEQTNVYF